MPSAVAAPTVPPVATSNGLRASLRRIVAVLADKARQLAGAVRATASRAANYVASKLAIPPSVVLPLALIALVVVALVIARRA